MDISALEEIEKIIAEGQDRKKEIDTEIAMLSKIKKRLESKKEKESK